MLLIFIKKTCVFVIIVLLLTNYKKIYAHEVELYRC